MKNGGKLELAYSRAALSFSCTSNGHSTDLDTLFTSMLAWFPARYKAFHYKPPVEASLVRTAQCELAEGEATDDNGLTQMSTRRRLPRLRMLPPN